jgi:hypothetical protein
MTILEFLFLEALTLAIPSVLILFAMYLLGYGGRGSVGRARRSSQPSLRQGVEFRNGVRILHTTKDRDRHLR